VLRRRAIALLRAASLAVALALLLGIPWDPGATPPLVPPSNPAHASAASSGGPTPSYSLSTIGYASSVDGFNLSYNEILPAGYSPNSTYPMAVELHGISASETTPMPGGYPTSTPSTTLDAAAAAGFILIVPNTRTGVGFYTDSPYTGPQAQDVLDAIDHEESLRSIGPVFLYGFSMGAMGTMSIGLSHPTRFAGLGAIATFSDLYETTDFQYLHNQTSLPGLLLDVAGGVLPNGSAFSRQVFDDLSLLRFHPERTSGLRVYLASGGQDGSATNNPFLWPYQQGNNSVLQTTCLTVAAYAEPSNCTLPLAVLHAVDPANYTYRYLIEPNGPHDYHLLNATDLYRFFSGAVGAGTYYGAWPDPAPVAPPVPLVTLATVPSNCGLVVVDGTPFPDGFTLTLPNGNHSVSLRTCPGFALASVRTSGGVVYDGGAGSLDVSSSGALVATFSPPVFHLSVSANVLCNTVSVNGSIVSNGSVVDTLGGTYAIAANACPPFSFASWSSSGSVRLGDAAAASTTLTVFGNGSVEAIYELPPPPPLTGRVYVFVAPANCGPVVVDGSYLGDGEFIDLSESVHSATAPSCSANDFVGWTLSGGLAPTGGSPSGSGPPPPTLSFSVIGDGSLSAVYAPRTPDAYAVQMGVVPAECGGVVVVDDVRYANGTTALLTSGIHALASASCPSHDFHDWSVLGAVDATTDSLTVNGNGSLTASYVAVDNSSPVDGRNATAPAVSWEASALLWGGVGAVVGLAVGFVVASWWRRPPSPRPSRPEPPPPT
jgi:pimeloyl-ACP methyl ester carboxylesterase